MPQTLSFSLTLTIDSALVPVAVTPPRGAINQPYNYQFVVSGGSGSYAWAVTSGALPPGLTLSASGLLSGTPTQAGDYNANFAVNG